MLCDECGGNFNPKYDGQSLCGRCYYELHPEQDFTRLHRERLWGALGRKTPRACRSFQAFSPEESGKGISDDEQVAELLDTLPTSSGAGIAPKRILKVGEKLSDGSVFLGKQGHTILENL